MGPAWLRLPWLLPPMSLLFLVAAPAASEPCLDGLGQLHRNGTLFYPFPGAPRPCLIYMCVNEQREVFQDRCPKKRGQVPDYVSSKTSPQSARTQFIQSKSSLPTEHLPSLTSEDQSKSFNSPAPFLPSSFGSPAPIPRSSSSSQSVFAPSPAFSPSPASPSSATSSSASSSVSAPAPAPAPASASALAHRAGGVLGQLRVSVCIAQNRRHYFEGQKWWDADDRPCHRYVCRSGQKLPIHSVKCKPVPAGCSEKFVFGKCCPVSTNCIPPPTTTTAPAIRPDRSCTSTTSGQTYIEGHSWLETEARPCHQYTCVAGRALLVQNVTCDPPNPRCRERRAQYGQCCDEQTQCGCLDRETVPPRERLHGAQWTSTRDPCVTLRCDEGQISELRRLPRPQPCPSPPDSGCLEVPPLPGVCACPTYKCDSSRPCISNGVLRPDGTSWQLDPCTIATCQDGAVHRERLPCTPLPDDCIPAPARPGECCPECLPRPETAVTAPETAVVTEAQQAATEETRPATFPEPGSTTSDETPATTQRPENSCEFEGEIYPNKHSWGNRCVTHFCFDGQLISDPVKCSGPSLAACAAVHQPASCCARWSCRDTAFHSICMTDGPAPESRICYRPGPQEGVCGVMTRPLTDSCCPVFECLQHCRDLDGESRQHGSSWEKDCVIYSCHNGTVSNRSRECPPPGDPGCRLTNPAECCPIYDCDCAANGTRHEDGALWTSGCHDHLCRSGEVTSRRVTCPDPPRPDCEPRPLEPGRCCPEFECSCKAVTCPPLPEAPRCRESGTSADRCCSLYSCPGDCRDDLQRVHTDGSRWFVNCSQYQCSGGDITNVTQPCPPAPRDGCRAIYAPKDSCCPIHDCPPPACTPGERSFDGCNHCECFTPGELRCSSHNCGEKGCTFDEQHHPHNGTWTSPADPCLVYSCRYGIVLASVLQCPPKPGPVCSELPPAEGHCCPDWNCSHSHGPCPSDAPSELTSWRDDCNVCTCTGSGVVCTDLDCQQQCRYKNQTYGSQEVITSSEDCGEHMCIDGVAISIYDSCKIAPNFTCRATDLYHHGCCPNWICDDLPEISSPCKTGEIFQGDQECMFCECIEDHSDKPQMICTKRDCVGAGCTVDGTYHAHGSVWRTSDPCRSSGCVSGQVVDMTTRCPDPPAEDCVSVPDDGRCCPLYYCGEKCEDGATFKSGCNDCFCRGGVEYCTTNQCDAPDEEGKST